MAGAASGTSSWNAVRTLSVPLLPAIVASVPVGAFAGSAIRQFSRVAERAFTMLAKSVAVVRIWTER
ncbi:MAG: hypothetical protein WDN69_05020 [Aliidongia sp.]